MNTIKPQKSDVGEMPILAHFAELRTRLIRMVFAVLVVILDGKLEHFVIS